MRTSFKKIVRIKESSLRSPVFLQIDNHMKKHDLYASLQSAYRKNHSTQTALLKVTNDILMEMNSQYTVLLVLLDLSAAFYTVDHSVLLRRLKKLHLEFLYDL